METKVEKILDKALDRANELCRHRKGIERNKIGSHSKRKILYLYSVLAMAHMVKATERESRFDTDSFELGVDNRASYCITNKIKDVVGPLIKTKRTIKGFMGARTHTIYKCTIKWEWGDDNGQRHKFLIPNSFYIPEGGIRLLSPQHWAQSQQDHKPI